jgi:hypothetical protein
MCPARPHAQAVHWLSVQPTSPSASPLARLLLHASAAASNRMGKPAHAGVGGVRAYFVCAGVTLGAICSSAAASCVTDV